MRTGGGLRRTNGFASIPGLVIAVFLLLPVPSVVAGSTDNTPLSVSVGRYVDEAFKSNPSLAAMKERIKVKENAAIRAKALDDPKVWAGVTNLPVRTWSFREEDMTGKEIGLSQMIPYPGKRAHLYELGMRDKEQTEFDLQEMRNMLRAEIKMAYAELASVRKQAEVVRRSREILGELVSVSREMYSVGKGAQPDVLRGQVDSGKMRDMLLMLENREKVLAIRLNTLSALPPDEPVPPLQDLAEFKPSYTRGQLLALYEAGRPARQAAQVRIRKGDIAIRHAEHGYAPDFEVSLSYMQRDATPDGTRRPDMFSAMVSATLPIWKNAKIEPEIREMKAEKEMAVKELANLDLETSNLVGARLATMENRLATAILYRTTLIPQAEQSFQATSEAYQVGKVDFPMVMDSVMSVLTFRKEYIAIVGELHMEKARLEAAVGGELDGMAPNPGENTPSTTKNPGGEGR